MFLGVDFLALRGCPYCIAGLGWEPTQHLRLEPVRADPALPGDARTCAGSTSSVLETRSDPAIPGIIWKLLDVSPVVQSLNHWIPLPSGTQR